MESLVLEDSSATFEISMEWIVGEASGEAFSEEIGRGKNPPIPFILIGEPRTFEHLET